MQQSGAGQCDEAGPGSKAGQATRWGGAGQGEPRLVGPLPGGRDRGTSDV